jgi:hypothetical protein
MATVNPTGYRWAFGTSFSGVAMLSIWFMACAITFSNAGIDVFEFVLAFYIAAAWGVIWLIQLVVSLWQQRCGKPETQSWSYWLVEPFCIALPLVLSQVGVFSFVRFTLSEPSLISYVEIVRAGKFDLAFEFRHPPRQVGLYTVTVTDLLPDGTVRVITSRAGMFDNAGFAHTPVGAPPKQGENYYRPIYGKWWHWTESW